MEIDINLIKEILTSGLSLIALIIALFKKGRVTTNSELEAIQKAKNELKNAKKKLKNLKKLQPKSETQTTTNQYNQTNQQNTENIKQNMLENKEIYMPQLDYLDKNYKNEEVGDFEE